MRAAAAALACLAVAAAAGCTQETQRLLTREPSLRLDARPDAGATRCSPGERVLVSGRRTALLRVTPARGDGRRALVLVLHGAGSGGARGGLYAFRSVWDVPGLVLVAPGARGSGWSLGRVDVDFVDRALELAFARCHVERDRVLVGGFSSGAGMALWLGLANGDLFHAIVSLSPGGSLPASRMGKPLVLLAHGTRDEIIPVEHGGDPVARELREDGYRVRYVRFDGGHRPVPEIVRSLVRRAAR